jgi:hypothetical protein
MGGYYYAYVVGACSAGFYSYYCVVSAYFTGSVFGTAFLTITTRKSPSLIFDSYTVFSSTTGAPLCTNF